MRGFSAREGSLEGSPNPIPRDTVRHVDKRTHMYIYIYTYTYVYRCLNMCVYTYIHIHTLVMLMFSASTLVGSVLSIRYRHRRPRERSLLKPLDGRLSKLWSLLGSLL